MKVLQRRAGSHLAERSVHIGADLSSAKAEIFDPIDRVPIGNADQYAGEPGSGLTPLSLTATSKPSAGVTRTYRRMP
ncbi:hypothetical protein [Allomesorhizobium camelthorni]|uniref:Uncharacterized protein n=1 Tax=Allomesorhizobium camelthorni TaxID=475069 RepID=A0A6G4WNH1_9HYPH|nr:hypothetical protein [Mesorhizobium camelthorni]NGO56129.1 hypothetical protein [Mesorhizobium camelthorni]